MEKKVLVLASPSRTLVIGDRISFIEFCKKEGFDKVIVCGRGTTIVEASDLFNSSLSPQITPSILLKKDRGDMVGVWTNLYKYQ